MKKLLLVGISACFCLSAVAQNKPVVFKETLGKQTNVCKEAISGTQPVKQVLTLPSPSQNKSSVISVVDIGSSANALTSAGGPKGNTDYNPATNTVTFIHRSVLDTALIEDPTSGYYRYDISVDGGTTWSVQQGPIYSDSTGSGNVVRGRYPQAVIINPAGNTVADSAFLTFFGVATTTTADWIANLHGTMQLGGPMGQVQAVDPFVSPAIGSVTSGLTCTQTNVVWNIDGAQSSTALDPPPTYTGIQMIYKGVWNATTNTVDYTRTDFPFPTSLKDGGGQMYIGSGIHFGADGLTGYMTIIANNQDIFATDSANLLTIFKTIDGGVSWDDGKTLMLDTVDAILALGTNLYETGFEQDGVVDANGNLHLITAILPSNNSAETIGIPGSGQWGIFDIYTLDGGITYRVKLLATPMTYRGTYDDGGAQPTPIDNRGQVSATWALDKLAFTWGDTDTTIFGPDNNLQPNVHCVGYDVTSGMWTSENDLTAGSVADAEVHIFNAAPYVIGTSGTYEIPVTYTTFANPGTPDPAAQVLHKYLKGVSIDDSQFTQTDAGLPLGVFVAGIHEAQSVIAGSVNIYPNPGKGVTGMEFTLKNNSDVKVQITNAIGQVVYSSELGKLTAGAQKVAFNTAEFGSGIYFCSLIVNGETITKKLAVE